MWVTASVLGTICGPQVTGHLQCWWHCQYQSSCNVVNKKHNSDIWDWLIHKQSWYCWISRVNIRTLCKCDVMQGNGMVENSGWNVNIYLFIFMHYTCRLYLTQLSRLLIKFRMSCSSLIYQSICINDFLPNSLFLGSISDTHRSGKRMHNRVE
jgi:hypothetical protein